MMEWSFIDAGIQDFLRDGDGVVIVVRGSYHDAESWLLEKGEEYGWTNTGTRFFNWTEFYN